MGQLCVQKLAKNQLQQQVLVKKFEELVTNC